MTCYELQTEGYMLIVRVNQYSGFKINCDILQS